MLTPVKAIRAKCLDCSGESFNEVSLCPIESCPLFPYRFGKNPNIKLSSEEKQRRAQNLAKQAQAARDISIESRSEGNFTPEQQNA